MMACMDGLLKANGSDDQRFKSFKTKMFEIQVQRTDRALSTRSIFGKGREPKVTELYGIIAKERSLSDNSLVSEIRSLSDNSFVSEIMKLEANQPKSSAQIPK